ncbi:sigma factor [Actinomadura sp. GTD37]|uniref:sigma factor n=1 Tax=Actinomadura sp. GTD37 TaxID=1778030 RepID=UPI0035C0FE10
MDDPESRFTRLYDENHRRVLAYALTRAEPHTAEDIAGETFLIAWRRLDDVGDPPLPWLLAVARNLLHEQRDRRRRGHALADRIRALTTPADLAAWDVAEHVVGRETALAAVAALPERDRDKAQWKKDGSPRLLAGSIGERTWEGPTRLTLGSGQVTVKELAALPADAAGLRAELRERYARDLKDTGDPFKGAFTAYVWEIAHDMLAGPITPGTKAALFKILAGEPGIRSAGKVTDRAGRTGVAVVLKTAPDGGAATAESRLVISQQTAALLEFRSAEAGEGTVTTTYEAMGWVGSLGSRP